VEEDVLPLRVLLVVLRARVFVAFEVILVVRVVPVVVVPFDGVLRLISRDSACFAETLLVVALLRVEREDCVTFVAWSPDMARREARAIPSRVMLFPAPPPAPAGIVLPVGIPASRSDLRPGLLCTYSLPEPPPPPPL